MTAPAEVVIVGAGIAGLTLGLALHERGIPSRIYERAGAIEALGVGINVLPHATRVLHALGLGEALARAGIRTREAAFFNRFGQHIYTDPLGLAAGYATPQISIHRADLQRILLDAYRARAGAGHVVTGAVCTGFSGNDRCVTVHFESGVDLRARLLVACDGIHSVIRKQLHPDEGAPRYSGVNMWRGVTVAPPFLSGATMVRAGWLATGKAVIYPVRDDVDGDGRQLINWVAEIERPEPPAGRDWSRPGRLEDFAPAFADWHFDWLDVPRLFRGAERIYEFPMVDQDPLPFWGEGLVTLMGDAAHPMVPRGSNGAGQAILDAECLARCLAGSGEGAGALVEYEAERLEKTARVVMQNRVAPPDIIIKEVLERTGDLPFDDISEVIGADELAAFQRRYKEIAGYDLATLEREASSR